MMIERIFPEVVQSTAPLVDRLSADARFVGFPAEMAARLVETLPPNLRSADCFLDKMTGLWRYEFGEPFILEDENQLLWGTHMWPPVQYLRRGLVCFLRRVPLVKQPRYLERLDQAAKHIDVLSEMIPLLAVNDLIAADFEVAGRGAGNKEVDWLIGPVGGREILCDVKSRSLDLIKQMDRNTPGTEAEPPNHDASLLFRSLEEKFLSCAPSERLQGAWIATHIKQEEGELNKAFAQLDGSKVHFAVLGHWEPRGLLLVRDESDRPFLREIFGLQESNRFVFNRASRPA